jgi:hypothetical protein
MKFCVFYVIFRLFSNFEAKRAKNGTKNQIIYYSFAPIKESVFLIFKKKSQIRCTLLYSRITYVKKQSAYLAFKQRLNFRKIFSIVFLQKINHFLILAMLLLFHLAGLIALSQGFIIFNFSCWKFQLNNFLN